MKQRSLFDDIPPPAAHSVLDVQVTGNSEALSKNQADFNRWIARIAAQRKTLAQWTAFRSRYQSRLMSEYAPLEARLRQRRIAMVKLLDTAITDSNGKTRNRAKGTTGLTRRERESAAQILLSLIDGLLAQGEEPELVEIHDRHNPVSLADEEREALELLDKIARNLQSDESDGDAEPCSDDAYRDDKSRGPESRAENGSDPSAGRASGKTPNKRAKTEKTLAREAAKQQATEDATKSVRDIFRKLASQLHPDREPDSAERERKTVLMQRVNDAYKRRDLLALFELQLEVEQINPGSMTDLSDARLAAYVEVLRSQSRELKREIDKATAPFQHMLGLSSRAKPSPAAVESGLNTEIARMKAVIKEIEQDLEAYRDTRTLKMALAEELEPELDEMAVIELIMAADRKRDELMRAGRAAKKQGKRKPRQ